MKHRSVQSSPLRAAPAPLPGASKFKAAAIILWLVAILQIAGGLALVVFTPEQVDEGLAALLDERRISLYEVKSIPAEIRGEFDQRRDAAILRVRLWHTCNILAGAVTVVCALYLRRRPLATTVTALLVFFLTSAATIANVPSTPMLLLALRVVILYTLTYALVAALVGKKERLRISGAVA